jgi:hypothetical protein
LILNLVYQFSIGTISSIQAVGNVRLYFIITSTLVLLNIPISYFLLKQGMPPYATVVVFIVIEVLCFVARLIMARKNVGIRITDYFKKVFVPVVLCIVASAILPLLVHYFMQESFLRLAVVCIIYALVYLLLAWRFLLEDVVRNTILALLNRFIRKKS